MQNDDVVLIHRILAGDEAAFAELVKKYQKPVPTLTNSRNQYILP